MSAPKTGEQNIYITKGKTDKHPPIYVISIPGAGSTTRRTLEEAIKARDALIQRKKQQDELYSKYQRSIDD